MVTGESKPWVMIAAVISTGHLPEDECNKATQELSIGFDVNPTQAEAENMMGFAVELTDEKAHNNHLSEFPTVMRLVQKFRRLGYNYLRFDQAGDVIKGLKLFDWEAGASEKPVVTVDLCPTCKSKPAEEPHVCPYKQDIDGDSTTLCRCCTACNNECASDV